MTAGSVLAVVLRVVDVLESLGVRFHLGGSFASTIHGVPRQTRDVDVVVDLEAQHGEGLVSALHGEFYIDSSVVADAIARRSSFNAIHLASGFKVDFFVKGRHQFDEVEIARSVVELIVAEPPRMAPVKSAEDTILRKLQWFAEGGGVSDQQWRDVLGVLKAQRERLDTAYLNHWALRLGLADVLERARADAV